MRIFFLEAKRPLTKVFSESGKQSYPLVGDFTSHEHQITTPNELFKAIEQHAKEGHCLIKGELSRALKSESRRGTTNGDQATQWVCLDFDRHETADLDGELARMNLGDISYVLQYSASHGTEGTEGTVSAHVFMLLSAPLPAPTLKAWLMDVNLTLFRDDLSLATHKTVLSWPLDITTCQNDKLLYIAPPVFEKPLRDPLKTRISLVPKKLQAIPVDRIGERHIAVLKTDERKVLNELRKAEGLPVRNAKTSWVGNCEVQNKPDECTVTGIREDGEFIRLNLNGGDSWAYWHPRNNFELIHDFKSDTWYKTKELTPSYYQQLTAQQADLTATPTEDGDLILAFRDLKTANYYNGIWNPQQHKLLLYPAKNETQLDHWMRSHGRVIGDFIPIWDIQYNPREDWTVDEDNHLINTFEFSHYLRVEPKETSKDSFPTILTVIKHMLGEPERETALSDRFLNWLAAIFQREFKPITAWVCHGTEGTGKGYFFNKIATPLLGKKNTISITPDKLEDQFNDFLENKLLTLVDEVDIEDFKEKGRVSAKLRNYITEPTVPMRRMRQSTVDVPNHNNFLFSSNKSQPVYIPVGDRRYNVGNFQAEKLMPPDDEAIDKELLAFAHFLADYKVNKGEANSVYHTEARERISKLSITSIAETCQAILTGDFDTLWLARPDERLMIESGIHNEHTANASAYVLLMKTIAREWPDALTRDEMQIILQYNVGNMPRNPNKFTSLLRHNGIETTRISKNNQKTYGIKVKWRVSPEIRLDVMETLGSKPPLRKVK